MYLAGPLHLSLAGVAAISVGTVAVSAAVMRFRPRRTMTALRVAVVMLWTFGVYAALRGGYEPGLTAEPLASYPWEGVLRVIAVISLESAGLFFIVCYRSTGPSIPRCLSASVASVALIVLDRPPTDMPGYAYANSNLLMLTVFILLAGLIVLAAGAKISRRLARG